jgi:hypothetical protein
MSMLSAKIMRALLDPMMRQKRAAIDGLLPIIRECAERSPAWWAWTVWLAYAITARRIQDA